MSSNTLSSENNGHDPAPTVQPLPGEVAAAKSKRAPGAASAGQHPRDPGGPFTGRSPAELTDTIGQLHALSCAAIGVMLEAVAAYDTTQAWREDGAGSLGQWLCYELGVTNATGAQYARVATALVDLPVMSCELAAGQLGFEQVRALTRVATADTEASLVSEARGMTASEVEAMVRRLRSVSTEEASRANASRSLRLRWGIEDRMLRVSGRFPEVDGAVIASAIEGLAEPSASPDDPEREPFDARCADALLELCSCAGTVEGSAGSHGDDEPSDDTSWAQVNGARVGENAGPVATNDPGPSALDERGVSVADEEPVEPAVTDHVGLAASHDEALSTDNRRAKQRAGWSEAEPVRAEIVVHVEAGVLASGGDGAAALECGPPVGPETVRRLACDGWIRAVVEDRGVRWAWAGDDGRCRGRCCTCCATGTAGAGSPGAAHAVGPGTPLPALGRWRPH